MTRFPKSNADPFAALFAEALSHLGPVEMRILHLTLSRVAGLQRSGRGAEADALLLGLLRIVRDDQAPFETSLEPPRLAI
ncbi:hypothetical protein [Brevundimonas sp.]|uniref:hypothetical protein n=1 Tax=Brevundimonas sp. TaxID=1871086 RepID=UPI003D0D76FD